MTKLRIYFGLLALLQVHLQSGAYAQSEWVQLEHYDDPIFQNLEIPADAVTKGMWSSIYDWPMNGLHSVLLPDARVLTFGSSLNGNSQNGRWYDIWDPSLGFGPESHDTVYDPSRQDSFCSAAIALPDGAMMISGGNGKDTSTIFNGSTHSSYTATARMAEARWYPTLITLADGRPIILGGMQPYTEGMVNQPDQAIVNGWPSMTPEILENGQWRSLFGAYSREAFGPDYLRTSYPRAWVAPDGRVFGISADQMWFLDANAADGLGEITSAGVFKGPYDAENPINVGATNTAVMFAPGQILQLGGNGGFNGDELPASDMATVVDINSGSAILQEQARMAYPRRYPNAVVLANGEVVVTGGTTYGNWNAGQPAEPVYAAEIWDSNTGNWQLGADSAIYRGYHSITALLANGTVLSTGGGTPGPVTNLNAEIYYPPYLFQSINGKTQLADRPRINAISGLTFQNSANIQMDLDSNTEIDQLVLIGTSSGTHSFNSGQRRIPLQFSQDQFRLTTTLPSANLAPPGYYQIVAVASNGAPSNGVIIGVGQSQAQPPVNTTPYIPPSLEEAIHTPSLIPGESVTYAITPVNGYQYKWDISDGTTTEFQENASITHTFNSPGAYVVTLTVKNAEGISATRSFIQAVSTEKAPGEAQSSSPILIDETTNRIWVVNPDNNSVSIIEDDQLISEISVGTSPRSIAKASDGRFWVSNKLSATISIINPSTFIVDETINLPRASQPHGLIFNGLGTEAYVVLEALGQLLKIDEKGEIQGTLDLGLHVRHIAISADSATILVTRFITPPVPGESTATIAPENSGGEILVIDANNFMLQTKTLLAYSTVADTAITGGGLPNYLGAPAISPDGKSAWIPSKQDNIGRGSLRNGLPLDFQNTVRAISSKLNLLSLAEEINQRVDHDNSSLATAAVFHPNGVYLFVALETSREVAVVNAINGSELFKISVGIAPQGVAISGDGLKLYVKNFIDRSISTVDLSNLITLGSLSAKTISTIPTVTNESLPENVLLGKALFYDAKDTRLSRDSYLSCATCHNDGDSDGRVWDLTGLGEGLRNTIALIGRGGNQHGLLHWSANFDEVQDFETQIRILSGGSGLMDDLDYNEGTRAFPLGDSKTGVSADLDALAAYVESLNSFPLNPGRNSDGSMTPQAIQGQSVFNNHCSTCHGGEKFTISSDVSALKNIGTIQAHSGQRLGAELNALDVPTLRDTWFTAPYLHDGSAKSITEAILAHNTIILTAEELANVTSYVEQLEGESASNTAPKNILDFPDINLLEIDPPITIDLSKYFFDDEGDALSFRHSTATPTSNITITGSFLNISPSTFGSSVHRIVADDGHGGQTSISFTLNINRVTHNDIQQAEDHRWDSATIDTNHAGYYGTGFVNTVNYLSNWFEFELQVPYAGHYTAALRYGNGSTNRAQEVRVNGVVQIASLDLPGTGSWKHWHAKTFELELNAGKNTVRFISLNNQGAPNIDQIAIESINLLNPGNQKPKLTSEVPHQTLIQGETKHLNLNTFFSDADQDTLRFTVNSSVNVLIEENTLILQGNLIGSEAINITCSDGRSGTVTSQFNFTVESTNSQAGISSPANNM